MDNNHRRWFTTDCGWFTCGQWQSLVYFPPWQSGSLAVTSAIWSQSPSLRITQNFCGWDFRVEIFDLSGARCTLDVRIIASLRGTWFTVYNWWWFLEDQNADHTFFQGRSVSQEVIHCITCGQRLACLHVPRLFPVPKLNVTEGFLTTHPLHKCFALGCLPEKHPLVVSKW